ncbi:MAG: hypothetical protein GY817_01600 [bacterium]|nr:hypothetical protein [bacterium]
MLHIGRINKLSVLKILDFGLYLDGKEFGEILLPTKFIPPKTGVGSILEVFVYFDSEDRIIATTQKPYVMVNQISLLKVVSVNSFGAFLDWGLDKDLLLPNNEQVGKIQKNGYYLVYAYIDKKNTLIAASEKIEKFIDHSLHNFKQGMSVDLLIYKKIKLGYKALINNNYLGILYGNEVFQGLKIGQKVKGKRVY